MFRLSKKAQSTAEYAIVLGLVVAVVAGVMQTALKGGIRQKNKQAMNYLLSAGSVGDGATEFNTTYAGDVRSFSEDFRETKIAAGGEYVDEKVMEKGGAEKSHQKQNMTTTAISVEKIN